MRTCHVFDLSIPVITNIPSKKLLTPENAHLLIEATEKRLEQLKAYGDRQEIVDCFEHRNSFMVI